MKTIHCNSCHNDLPETDFPFKDKASGRRHTKCKACKREYSKQHYAQNTEAYIARVSARNKEVKAAYHAVLEPLISAGICVGCGVPHGKLVAGNPTRLVFTRKYGYEGPALHEVIREKMGQAVFDKALENSELKCNDCAFSHYAENLKPTQFGAPGATLSRRKKDGAAYSLSA